MIAGHNTLDGVSSAHMASLGWMWKILHEGFAQIALRPGTTVIVAYPLIPWIGVMSAGYCFGRVFDLPPAERRSLMFRVGAGLTAAFVVHALGQHLRRSEPVVGAIHVAHDAPVVSSRVEVPAVASLSSDDAGAFASSRSASSIA